MIVFQDDPDTIFLAIVDEALAHTREVHLVRYREGYRPTRAERRELEESYRDLFPELVPLFTRRELVRMIDRLRRASRDERRRYALTDYHWLVLYSCLLLYCDLHNDGAAGDQVGPYEIELRAATSRPRRPTRSLSGSSCSCTTAAPSSRSSRPAGPRSRSAPRPSGCSTSPWSARSRRGWSARRRTR